MHDLQKANMLKRISAYLFDLILLMIAIVGAALMLSSILGFSDYIEKYEQISERYMNEYGLTITDEEYEALSDEQKAEYDAAYDAADKAFTEDEEANETYLMILSQALLITSISLLIAFLALEFIVPLLFGNGQTLGKKIFGIAVMHINSTKVSALAMFVRTVLGKYTLETMIPVLIIIMMYFGNPGLVGIIVLLLIAVMQITLLIKTPTNSCLHDKLSSTVTVDMASQMIFENTEELLAYKQRIHAEAAEKKPYF